MTNEQTYERFAVIWNGRPEHYLCVQRDEDVIRREEDPPSSVPAFTRLALVLQAIDSVYRGRHEIASRAGLDPEDVRSDLYVLFQKRLVRRSRTQNTPWLYRRVTV